MKRVVSSYKKIILLVALVILVFRAGAGFAATLSFQTGVNFDWWGNNRDSHATQFFTPVLVEGKYGDASVRFLTAYAETRLSSPGYGTTSLGHFLDSKLGMTYQVVDKLPVDILFGLDLNLPTGKTNLSAAEVRLIMDPNLISINNFGEGFNVNPTITVAKKWHDWSAALGVGYLWRGSYDFSTDLNLTDYQPGEIYTATGEVRYSFTPEMYGRLFGGYSWYGKDTSHGIYIYQEGDVGFYGLGVYYQRPKLWDASLTFSGVVRGKVKDSLIYPDGTVSGALALESGNINRDEYIVDLLGRYSLDDKTILSVPLQYKYLAGNGYGSANPFGLGGASKVSFAVGVTRTLGSGLSLEVNLKGFFLHGDMYQIGIPTISSDYSGFTGNIALIGKFQ